MAHYRNFDIETTIVPDVAGQYEAAFVVAEVGDEKSDKKNDENRKEECEGGREEVHDGKHGENPQPNQQGVETTQQAAKSSKDNHRNANHARRYKFPPVGSYFTPDDAREQTEAWARKWIDENFPA